MPYTRSGGDGDPRVGAVLDDRFHLVGRLGDGGMGVVYRAVQLSVGREVALKVMGRPDSDMADERFQREARLASRLCHPAIVTTHDCGRTAAGELWIAMELLDGRSLRELLEAEGALPVERALAIAEQVAAALAAAHQAGIIHRDVKPSNVMVLDDERAKLLDFGLARTRCGDDDTLTCAGVVCGTPAYLAPEVALGFAADERSDVYGLGVMLHEMLAGAHPFAARTPAARMTRALDEPAPRLPDVPGAVADVVLRLLARDPDRRCGSAAIARAWIAALRAGCAPARQSGPRRRRGFARLALATTAAIAVIATIGTIGTIATVRVSAAAHHRAPMEVVYRGTYQSAGNPECTRGTVTARIHGDRLSGTATSDGGRAVELVGVQRPSGAIVGLFMFGGRAMGWFEGELVAGRVRGTVADHVYHCTGSFELSPAR